MSIQNLANDPARTNPVKGPPCAVCQTLDTLPADESAALLSLLRDRTWRYQQLSEALAADPDTPLDLPAWSLSRHARGQCARREKLR